MHLFHTSCYLVCYDLNAVDLAFHLLSYARKYIYITQAECAFTVQILSIWTDMP